MESGFASTRKGEAADEICSDAGTAAAERRSGRTESYGVFYQRPETGKEQFMASKASAVWTGSLKEGKGSISTATGVLKDANYSFQTRFEGADSGTTPE